MKLTEFITDIGRPVAFYPGLRKITKSTTATLFLCQLIYWTGKQVDPDGWIYKTSDEIEIETGLPYDEQATARKHLLKLGFIEEIYKRLDHKMIFRIMADTINQEWRNWHCQDGETGITAFGKAVLPVSLNESETTSEITTEINNGEKELAIEKEISSEKPDPKQELRPSTEGGSLLLEKLSSEQRARGRAAVKYFETLVQKQAFEAAETRLGLAELEKAMNKGLQTGLRDRSRLINYIVKWNPGRVWNQPTFETGQPMIIQARD